MLLFDPRHGASGDMILSALIDLGADEKKIERLFNGLVRFSETKKVGIRAKKLVLKNNPKMSISEIQRRIKSANIGSDAKKLALGIFRLILNAEARVHRSRELHLHQIGEFDTFLDIVGTCAALESLGYPEVYSLPINCGSPAPATMQIISSKRFPVIIGGPHELATPTGVAILAMIAKPVSNMGLIPKRVGRGAGEKDYEWPNVLTVIEAEDKTDTSTVILETNVDDTTGEVLGYAIERLMESGAKDAYLLPVFGKKGRPGYKLEVICDVAKAHSLVRLIMDETGTLGVREIECKKHSLGRSFYSVKTENGKIKIKRAHGIQKEKPEYEDIYKIARKSRIPLRTLLNKFSK
ncbi:MAG: nickel pincer cofactor biosynthesis protein LarC [Candidatus Micrarchaeia archaeon]